MVNIRIKYQHQLLLHRHLLNPLLLLEPQQLPYLHSANLQVPLGHQHNPHQRSGNPSNQLQPSGSLSNLFPLLALLPRHSQQRRQHLVSPQRVPPPPPHLGKQRSANQHSDNQHLDSLYSGLQLLQQQQILQLLHSDKRRLAMPHLHLRLGANNHKVHLVQRRHSQRQRLENPHSVLRHLDN